MVQLIKDVVRGTAVKFEANFYNVDGVLMAPNSATVYINYRANNVSNTTTLDMVAVNSYYWSTTWDTSGVDAGTIDWTVVVEGDNRAVSEGSFRILANRATP